MPYKWCKLLKHLVIMSSGLINKIMTNQKTAIVSPNVMCACVGG